MPNAIEHIRSVGAYTKSGVPGKSEIMRCIGPLQFGSWNQDIVQATLMN
jgi:hypothetical protein